MGERHTALRLAAAPARVRGPCGGLPGGGRVYDPRRSAGMNCRLPHALPAAQVASQQGAYVAHLINRRYRVGKGGMSTDPPTKPARGMEWIDRVTGSVDLDDAELVGAAVGNPNP